MAMAVAVKNPTETLPQKLLNRWAVDSWLGVVYLLVALGVVFYAIPGLWAIGVTPWLSALGAAVNVALMMLIMLGAAGAFVFVGMRLIGAHPPPGLRAGTFVGFVEVISAGLLTCWIGRLFEGWMGEQNPVVGAFLTAAVGVALLGLAIWGFWQPRFEFRVLQFEEQGWFQVAAYKRTQGQRVRRGTILGILVLAVCGLYTMLAHRSLETLATKDWQVAIPFTNARWTLLPDVRFTLPLLLVGGSLWLAYRVVNLPVFADFLIATEAEMNKVSWTTRKRLVQDTIVVLVTVVLLTLFLFAVDQLWGLILTRVGVVQPPPATIQDSPNKDIPW
jgi:preprotein translocase SecE subunit